MNAAPLPPMHAALSALGTMAGQYLAAQSAQAQAAQAQPPQAPPTVNTSYARQSRTMNGANLCDVRMPCDTDGNICVNVFPCRFAMRNQSTLMARKPIPTAVGPVLRRCRKRLHQVAVLLRGARAPTRPLVPMPNCVTYVTFPVIKSNICW
jgi:hypothetical protein